MLSKECFTREWIYKVREDNPPADHTIVEKTIYTFALNFNNVENDSIYQQFAISDEGRRGEKYYGIKAPAGKFEITK
jgi:hypothetical protein